MKALILGRGRSGQAAEAILKEKGYEVTFAESCDLVIASPGIVVRSELQLGVERLKEHGTKLLAVTGSKGKSSVVKLVADAINLMGQTAVPCGNYGRAVSSVGSCDWAIVEVSSFQMETTYLPADTFRAAAILNLQEDHLDRHGDVATYHALKRRLLTMSEVAIEEPVATPSDCEILRGSYFDNAILRQNGLIALALMRCAGVSDVVARQAFQQFTPLPHRMNEVAVIEGVRYINDSKATSLSALSAALQMLAGCPIRLIAGGLPKGDDPKSVCEGLTKGVKKVYLIGVSAEKFAAAWSGSVTCECCGTLAQAVAHATRDAQAGETILLSPGCASYDQFQSFEERGDVFVRLVQKEGKKE